MVFCDEKDEPSVDLDSAVPQDTSSGGLCESGDRSEKTCRCLWQSIPSAYRAGHCYSDFWKAYQAVIPEEQHTAAGKETGETAHVERWNNTLRQRLARFVRKTLSFSKSLVMHDACLKLFLHRYNRCRELSASCEPRPGRQDDEHKNGETTLLHGFLLMSRVLSHYIPLN